MRENKFRVYDKLSKKMYYDSNLENGEMIVLTVDGHLQFSSNDGTYRANDFEIMQYTGLKDKNGKEIYEGDVVISEMTKIKYHVIFDDDGCFRGVENQKASCLITKIDFNKSEIIGNIYENSELLKNGV